MNENNDNNNVIHFPTAKNEPLTVHLGKVVTAKEGVAMLVAENGNGMKVCGWAADASALQYNDEVFYVVTTKGAYILGRILRENEFRIPRPHFVQTGEGTLQLNFGAVQITIQQDGKVEFKTPHASLKLDADGQVHISGKTITQKATEEIELNAGGHIKLTCPEAVEP